MYNDVLLIVCVLGLLYVLSGIKDSVDMLTNVVGNKMPARHSDYLCDDTCDEEE